ncbi:MAG TPA: SDR family NAD(P)-dependent oxidoreductase [Streptosporangiaceae bacterium]|nr:SDR family NAD(P)-dependent oxidoreductase [Streptosporangiaceae bacterium]
MRAAVAAAAAAGPVGVLVNNAGGVEDPCFPAAPQAKWERTLDLNLRAAMLATQLVLPAMAGWRAAPAAPRGGGVTGAGRPR